MVDNIFLSTTQSSLLQSTQQTAFVRQRSSEALSTGRRVNEPRDEPVDYFRAQALLSRLSDLGEVKSSISLGQNTIQASSSGLDAVEDLGNLLKGIANSAKTAESAVERDALVTQFNEISSQIDNLVGDTSFLGTNLLETTSSRLNTQVGDSSSSTLLTEGSNNTIAGLGIGDASADYNGFATLSDIDAAISAVDQAIATTRSTQADYATDLAILNTREDFVDDLSAELQRGVDQTVNADLNEEAATQLAAQVRSSLATTGQRILAEGQSLLVSIF
ncbi:hypothetical protein [Terasakiella sp. SH-1]|uniref:flagellin n=1 Tax=Terasakiella sp. SH-1 TaxID=2560057 RepID=UPI0010744B8B|nr:hypothetical protein [Terasakiella sp. SH-1]